MPRETKATVYFEEHDQCSLANVEAPTSACEGEEASTQPEAPEAPESAPEAATEPSGPSQAEFDQYKQYHDQTNAWVQQNRELLSSYQEQREAFQQWQQSQQQEEELSYFDKVDQLAAQQAEFSKTWQEYQQKQAEQAFEAEAKALQAQYEGVDFNKVYSRFAEYDGRVSLAQVAAWVALESRPAPAPKPPVPTSPSTGRDGYQNSDMSKDIATKMREAKDPWSLVHSQ